MHDPLEAIPVNAECEGIAVVCTRGPGGFDPDGMLRGLPDNLCRCPHWGYVVQGRMLVRYADGSEEEIKAGEVCCAKAGHTAVIGEDTVAVDFSPIGRWRQLMQHLAARPRTV